MLGEKHDLVHEFPEQEQRIAQLRAENQYFADLLKQYDDLDAEIRELELQGGATSDEMLEGMKMKRVHLKDQLYAMLQV